jgi:hypothetical protein
VLSKKGAARAVVAREGRGGGRFVKMFQRGKAADFSDCGRRAVRSSLRA